MPWYKRTRLIKPIALISAFLVAVANLLYLGFNNLHPDEAYYWVWSKTLEPGYFDNSPLIAYVIRLFTELGGDSVFMVRLPALLGWFFVMGFIFYFTRRIYRDQATAYLALLIAAFTPLIASGSHLMTPDAIMIIFASFVWYLLYLAIEEERREAWYGVGIFFGLALLAKFQAALIALAVLVMLLTRPTKRKLLLKKEPYLAVLIGLIIFLPVIYWNWTHHWAAFLFQTQHGINRHFDLGNLGEFLAGQLGVFSLLFLGLLYYTLKRLFSFNRPEPGEAFLIGSFLPVFCFFALTSLTYSAGPNWPAVAYPPAIVFLAGQLQLSFKYLRAWKRSILTTYLITSFLVSLLLLALIRYPGFFISTLQVKLGPDQILTNTTYGWDQLGKRVDTAIADYFPNQRGPLPVFADDSYQIASELEYYISRPVQVFTTREARHSQFDYTTIAKIKGFANQPGLLVLQNGLPAKARNYFTGIEPIADFTTRRYGFPIRSFQLFRFQKLNAPALYNAAFHKPLGYPGTYKD